ncbi:putative F-box/kelch-repeat protein [Cardamine amara subsp. amara]|uniref:F-box/kelch-repeat protein n=1 Tax=Cardamine amara subsp. amara TaxID=228776 RepID=A0ABD0ZZS2_CARAN
MNQSRDTSSPRTSFSSLPDDIILNCLARVSRIHYPTLSIVSKGFRSLLASPELDATRSRIGKTDSFQYVCLNLNISKPNPQWFILYPIPKQQKLVPIPWFPHQHPQFEQTVVSSGSEIYLIGGFVKRKIFNTVLALDCRSHQWRRLPNMPYLRGSPAAEVIDGKIYVIGGCEYENDKNWGEVYDPKTKTWEPLTKDDVTIQRSVDRNICLVEINKILCQIYVSNGILKWYEPKRGLEWRSVKGLEQLSPNPHFPNYLKTVTYSSGGRRRVTVWWKSEVMFRRQGRHWETAIWCAEVSFERGGFGDLWGFVD